MQYVYMEVKKLLQEKLFLVFIMLSLGLNIGLCFSAEDVRAAVCQMAACGADSEGGKIYDTLNTNAVGSYYYNER